MQVNQGLGESQAWMPLFSSAGCAAVILLNQPPVVCRTNGLRFFLRSDIEHAQLEQHAFEHSGFDLGEIALGLLLEHFQ